MNFPICTSSNVRSVAWFPNAEPLRSGWAWGQKYLDKGIEMAEANVGQGRVFLFGNELLFRSQPHGTESSGREGADRSCG